MDAVRTQDSNFLTSLPLCSAEHAADGIPHMTGEDIPGVAELSWWAVGVRWDF